MQFSQHSSLLFQHMCNSYFYITTFLSRRTTVFKLCQVSTRIWWSSSVSHVLCLSSQIINLMNIAKHKIEIMLFPFLLKDKNLFWSMVHNLLKKEDGEEYIMKSFIICTVINKVVWWNYPRELDVPNMQHTWEGKKFIQRYNEIDTKE